MNLRCMILLTIAGLLGSGKLLIAQETNVNDLTLELTGERPAIARTVQQWDMAYARVLDAMMPDMGSDDPAKRGGPQRTLERIAFHASRPGADVERASCSKAIAARLQPDVPLLASLWLFRQLERIGRAEAVPQLAKFLGGSDPLIRESARRALVANPSAEANDALGKAVGMAETPEWRIALINGLASRRNPSNQDLFLREFASENDEVRIAAILGLAKIGDRSAAGPIANALNGTSVAVRRVAADSYLLLADALAEKGDAAAALAIYRTMLSSPAHLRSAALIGIGKTGSAHDLSTLFDALADSDARVRGACVEALALLKGNDVTTVIAARMGSVDAETRRNLLLALTRRNERGTLPTFAGAADDPDQNVRVAAVRGLGIVGDSSVVPLLLKIAATDGEPQTAARESLEHLNGNDVNKILLANVTANETAIRLEVIRALSARRVAPATPALLKMAQDANAQVRAESLKALGAVAEADALPAAAALVLKLDDDGARREAANALVKIAGRESDVDKRSDPILRVLESADAPAKVALLGVLGRIGGQKSLDAVRAALKDDVQTIRDAGIRALADWQDAGAAEDLLGIARSATDQTQAVLAIRGYIRLARLESNRPAAQTAKMLAAGLEAAKRPEEKRQALGGLAEVRHIAALEAVVPYLSDPSVIGEARSAAVRIGREIVNQHPEAVRSAMQKVLATSTTGDVSKQAAEILDRAEQKLKDAAVKS